MCHFSDCFQKFDLSLVFRSLIMMLLGLNFFEFILFAQLLESVGLFVSLAMFEEFSAIFL